MTLVSRKGQAEFSSVDGELTVLDPAIGTAPCVPGIKNEVELWVKNNYNDPAGCTNTSQSLLNYWFHSDHRLADGRSFAYNSAQREAMETLVYLFEVAKVRRQKAMLERYALASKHVELLRYDDFPHILGR
jgi:type III restriction enzyme